MDCFRLEEAISRIKKVERKLIAFWFYPSRHLSFEEALIQYQYESKHMPKFKPREKMVKRCRDIEPLFSSEPLINKLNLNYSKWLKTT